MLIQLHPLLAKYDCCGNYYDSSPDTEDTLSVQDAIEELISNGWAEIDGKLCCPYCYVWNKNTGKYEARK